MIVENHLSDMINVTKNQYFTEEEAKALKRKLVRAKTGELSVEIGSFGKVTMVDKYGLSFDTEGKPLLVWEVGIK